MYIYSSPHIFVFRKITKQKNMGWSKLPSIHFSTNLRDMGLTWQSFLCELRGRLGDSNGADLLRKTHTYSPYWIPEFVFTFFSSSFISLVYNQTYIILLSLSIFFVGGNSSFLFKKPHRILMHCKAGELGMCVPWRAVIVIASPHSFFICWVIC